MPVYPRTIGALHKRIMEEFSNQVKLAAGGSGAGSGGPTFRAGQKVNCKILERARGGYKVLLVDFAVMGFLPSEVLLADTDQSFVGECVCFYNGRLLIRDASV